MGALVDLAGQKFGRWTVVSFAGMSRHGKSLWNVRCDCGESRVVVGSGLRSGSTTSCGKGECAGGKGQHMAHPHPTDEALRHQYIDLKRNARELAVMYGVTPTAVRKWLDAANISRRDRKEILKLSEKFQASTAVHAERLRSIPYAERAESAKKGDRTAILAKLARIKTQEAQTWITCEQCKKSFPVRKSDINKGRRFCTPECAHIWQRGKPKKLYALPAWLKEAMDEQAR